jgi:hypothetical protein
LLVLAGLPLGDFIEHFEPAFFSREHVAAQHNNNRRKREAINNNDQHDVVFNITAHNRYVLALLISS